MRFVPGLPGLIRLATLAALALYLLLINSCAATGVQTAQETRGWERCDRSWPANLTFVCFQR